MLLVAPPGQLPPSATPILSATMSTIDLGSNCLSMGMGMGSSGCGGTYNKSALEAMDASNTHTTPTPMTATTTTSPSTPSPSPHHQRPLTLFAKIKRQLSKPNVALPSPSPSPTNTTHPNALLVPSTDLYYAPPAEQIRRSDRVSFAPAPSFHSASPVGTAPATPETASLVSVSNNITAAPNRHPKQKKAVKQQQRRRRRRHSSAESDCSLVSLSAVSTSQESGSILSFAGPSTYSDESALVGGGGSVTFSVDVGIPSIIGSSASFFAALDRGMDGRKGRRGSGDEDDSGFVEPASFEGHFAFPDSARYFSGGRRNSDPDASSAGHDDTPHAPDGDAQSVHSFAPYLPLVMQHERRQQGRDARVSLDDVASLSDARSRSSTGSRASTAGSRSVSTRDSRRGAHAVVLAPAPAPARVRRHVPPPLHPAPARASVHRDAYHVMHPYVLEQQYSPTSSASSRSPITPSTPFFTASEASLEDEDEVESDDASRISMNATRRNHQDDHKDKILSARLSMDTFGHRTTSSLHPRPKAPSTICVNVHPPTPTMPDLAPGFVLTPRSVSSGDVSPTESGEDGGNRHRSASNASAVKRRSRQNLKGKSPPLSPPPSGPLPLLPASPPSSHASLGVKVKAAYGSHCQRDSLVTQSSAEYSTHRHPSPFANTLSESESELWDEEAVLNIPGDAFMFQHAAAQAISSDIHQLLLSAQPFVAELGPASAVGSTTDAATDSESDYASFSSAHSHAHAHSASTHSAASAASASSEETPSESEHRSRAAAILAANTRANADGFFMPVEKIKIEIARQQAAPPKQTRSGGEWTLGLGLAGLEVPPPLSSSSPSSAVSSVLKADQKATLRPTAFPALAGDVGGAAAAATLLVKKKRSTVGSFVTPSVSVTAAADDRRSLRERTQSESALGAGARWKDAVGAEADGAASPAPNEDWTLSLPLPSFKKLRKLPAEVADADPVVSQGRHSHPTRMGGVDILVTDVDAGAEDIEMTSTENADGSDTDDLYMNLGMEDSDLSTESGPAPTPAPEPAILSVPRLVTRGSGIERAASASSAGEPRPRTRSITLDDADVELLEPGYAAAHAQAKANADENLAKLSTLSADLARFNEMLRAGGSRLRQAHARRGGAHEARQRGLEGEADAFWHAGDGERAGGKGTRSALKHARSVGVLDEAPPKNTILRMASVGDLLGGDSEHAKAKEKTPTKAVLHDFGVSPSPSILPALIDNSPTLPQPDMPIVTQQEPDQGASTNTKRPSSSDSNAPTITPSLARTTWRNVSGNSGSSSSTVTATPANTSTKSRATLPFAPPPSAFVHKATAKAEVANGTVGNSVAEGVVPAQKRPGLASGSALNEKKSSRTLSRSPSSLKTEIKAVESVAIQNSSQGSKSEGTAPQDDTAEPSSQTTQSRISFSSTSSGSTASPVATPTQASVPLPPLTICTSALPSPSRPRRQSTSSTSSQDTVDSSVSLTPTLSPAYDSSTLPTPLASSFPVPPTTNPMVSSFGDALRVRLAAAGINSTAPKDAVAVKIPERKSSSASSSPPKGVGLTFEERIRRLQELGMEAVVVRSVGHSPNSSSVSKAVKEREKEKETESDCSDFYYSARSSFTSER
ncbi:hypothetical protein BJ912DRAFT_43962 [Pholiota molesta]|nr:hypothetical protein BJ912DRAFT_43962 [Pholiota molesta]